MTRCAAKPPKRGSSVLGYCAGTEMHPSEAAFESRPDSPMLDEGTRTDSQTSREGFVNRSASRPRLLLLPHNRLAESGRFWQKWLGRLDAIYVDL
jgi:hypothetical protein